MSLLGYSLTAFDTINYLIGAEEDRIINGDKGKGHNRRLSVWGMGCEEEAVGSEDQQVRLMKADSSGKQEEEMKVI